MKTRFFALAATAALLLNVAGLAIGDTHRAAARNPQVSRLISLLPASDAVVVFDAKRFLDDAMPRLLAANQPMLTQITGKIGQIQTRTGIDLHKFDQVVVGVSVKPGEGKDADCDAVALAGGDINAGALVAMAKLASNGKYREEKIGGTTVYTFTLKDAVKTQPAKPAGNTQAKAGGTTQTTTSKLMHPISAIKGMDTEVAVAALDGNTLALGCPAKVRETIEAKTHVGSDLTDLLFARETAVMSFAAKTPAGMSRLLPVDNDDLGATVKSIQYMSGSVDVSAVGTSLQMMARTTKPEQAASLKDTLEALQILGKAALGNAKKADQQVFGRMVKNAKFAVNGNDVTLDLLVPQADIDILVAGIK